MFFLADTSQKVDDICFAYSCIYSVQFKFRRKFSYFAPSDNRERPETRLINGLLPNQIYHRLDGTKLLASSKFGQRRLVMKI